MCKFLDKNIVKILILSTCIAFGICWLINKRNEKEIDDKIEHALSLPPDTTNSYIIH